MLNSENYSRNNKLQRQANQQIIDEFSHRFKWRPDGYDSLLDIGCGTGDATADVILPLLPQKFNRLVCADISDKMLSIARTKVRSSKAAFEVLDIGRPLDQSVWSKPFDHITSFFCLHWVHEQRQAMQNIYDLLSPGGDCLLAYVGSSMGYTVFSELAKRPRWAPHLQDVHKHIPVFQFSNNIAEYLESIMEDVGFSDYSVQIRDKYWEFDGIEKLKCK